jgi:MFS family permease
VSLFRPTVRCQGCGCRIPLRSFCCISTYCPKCHAVRARDVSRGLRILACYLAALLFAVLSGLIGEFVGWRLAPLAHDDHFADHVALVGAMNGFYLGVLILPWFPSKTDRPDPVLGLFGLFAFGTVSVGMRFPDMLFWGLANITIGLILWAIVRFVGTHWPKPDQAIKASPGAVASPPESPSAL